MRLSTRFVFAMILIVMSVSACLPDGAAPVSRVKIDSGDYITGKSENKVPGVGYILIGGNGACTATAVSDNTLLTAAHCIDQLQGTDPGQKRGSVCITNAVYKNICTNNVFYPAQFDRVKDGDMRYDVAIAIFPRGTFKDYFAMSNAKVSSGMNVLLIGYSDDNPGPSADGSKRWGRNIVQGRDSQDGAIRTNYGGTSDKVAVSPGDSGGPMFGVDCRVIGVASRMAMSSGKFSLHTDVTASVITTWMREQESKADAYFCGLSGSDPTRCVNGGLAQPVTNLAAKEFPCAAPVSTTPPTVPNPQPQQPSTPPTQPGPQQPQQPSTPPSPPANMSQMFVALADDGASPTVLASVPVSLQVASADLCQGTLEACRAGTGNIVAKLVPASEFKIADRVVLKSTSRVTIADGVKYVILARQDQASGSSNIVGELPFRVSKR